MLEVSQTGCSSTAGARRTLRKIKLSTTGETTANGETYAGNIYAEEPSGEIVYRKLVNGSGTYRGRVVVVHAHPPFRLSSLRGTG